MQGIGTRPGLPGTNRRRWESLFPDVTSELGLRFCHFTSPPDSAPRRRPISAALSLGGGALPVGEGALSSDVTGPGL